MKEFQDEAMGDWEEVPPTPQKTRKKKEFTEETAKKYWEMRTADFAGEKRASVTRNNRGGAKKQASRWANREGMDTPPREEPQEEKLKSRAIG